MAEESVSILKVDTQEAVKNINDLKENIKLLKERLGDLTIGETKYQETLEELKVNQNALKDAMYATTASLKDVAAAAQGSNVQWDENNKLVNKGNISYNELVHTMAALKEEWRATNDEARRSELGVQIAEINQQLKDMDASVGNFSRNVGNYESGAAGLIERFDKFGGILKDMPPTLGAAKEQIGKVGETMQLVGKQPILGIIGLLAPIIIKITGALKENQTAMDAVKKLMSSLDPIMQLFQKALEGIAKGVAKVADWLGRMIGKVTERFTQAKEEAEEVGEAIAEGLEEATPDAVKAAEEMGEKMAEAIENKLMEIDWDKVSAANMKKIEAERKVREAAAKEQQEIFDMIEDNYDDINAEIEASLDEEIELYADSLIKQREIEKEKAQTRAETLNAVGSATSNLMNALADLYESDEKNSEKNAKKVKALRIASATIEMLQGAVAAFSSAQTLPPPIGQIVGAANAAAVIAMGVANINKIKSTNMSGGSGASASATAPAAVSAPNVETGMQSVRNVTSASEEERLNRMASPQKVYILQSDIEAANNQSKAQVAESSF